MAARSESPVPVVPVLVDAGAIEQRITRRLFGECLFYGYPYMWDGPHGRMHEVVRQRLEELGTGILGHLPGVGVVTHDYHWKNVIGPLEERSDPTPRFHGFDSPLHLNFGTHEYGLMLEEYRDATGRDVEGTIQVNIMTGTAQEAADWVEYMNAPAGGSREWADRRGHHGHPEPFGIRTWELGNEPLFTLADVGSLDAVEYVKRVRAFATAMKERDPSISIAAYAPFFGWHGGTNVDEVGRFFDGGPGAEGLTWTQLLLRDAGDVIDRLYFHWYGGWNERWTSYEFMMTSMHRGLVETMDRLAEDVARFAPDDEARERLMTWICPEWGALASWFPPSDAGTSLKSAVAGSRLLHVFAARPEIESAQHLALYAPYPDPPMEHEGRPFYFALLGRDDGSDCFGTAHYHMKVLWSKAFEPGRCAVSIGEAPAFPDGTPAIDVTALVSEDRSRMSVICTNAATRPCTIEIRTEAFAPAPDAVMLRVDGDDPRANNTWEERDRVTLRQQDITLDEGPLELPPCSVTALLLRHD